MGKNLPTVEIASSGVQNVLPTVIVAHQDVLPIASFSCL